MKHTPNFISTLLHYYPFGLTMAGICSRAAGALKNKKLYQNYETNSDFDLNNYETFYRTHDPQIGRFLQIDPKPNYGESLYSAMGNNPIKNIDVLGDTFIFPNASASFVNNFKGTGAFLKEKGAGQLYEALSNASTNVKVVELKSGDPKYAAGSYYDPNTNTLYWAPKQAVLLQNNVALSPATILNHELDHAWSAFTIWPGFDSFIPDEQFDTKGERRVITGWEKYTAMKLGEIESGMETRSDHNTGVFYEAETSTSNKPTQGTEKLFNEVKKLLKLWGLKNISELPKRNQSQKKVQ